MMPSAGDGDGQAARIVQVRGDDIDTLFEGFVARCGHPIGLAEEPERDVIVVDEQIEHAAAGLGLVFEPQAPSGRGAAAAEDRVARRSECGQGFFHGLIHGEEAQHMGDHKRLLLLGGFGDESVAIRAIERHGLFKQNMLAGLQRLYRNGDVKMGWEADVHCVDIPVGKKAVDLGVLRNASEIELFTGSTEVALDAGEVTREGFGIVTAYGGKGDVGQSAHGFDVRAAHETESENGDTHKLLCYRLRPGCDGGGHLEVSFATALFSDSGKIWVFSSERSAFPGGLFTDRGAAERWIAKHRLSGTLTLYPLDVGVYDLFVEQDWFRPKRAEHGEAKFIGGFTSAGQDHDHYEDAF